MDTEGQLAILVAEMPKAQPLQYCNAEGNPHIYHLGVQSWSTAAWIFTHSLEICQPCTQCE